MATPPDTSAKRLSVIEKMERMYIATYSERGDERFFQNRALSDAHQAIFIVYFTVRPSLPHHSFLHHPLSLQCR
jgi:hypothetical protein